jgi:uncharacterized protein (TIGR03437 family)
MSFSKLFNNSVGFIAAMMFAFEAFSQTVSGFVRNAEFTQVALPPGVAAEEVGYIGYNGTELFLVSRQGEKETIFRSVSNRPFVPVSGTLTGQLFQKFGQWLLRANLVVTPAGLSLLSLKDQGQAAAYIIKDNLQKIVALGETITANVFLSGTGGAPSIRRTILEVWDMSIPFHASDNSVLIFLHASEVKTNIGFSGIYRLSSSGWQMIYNPGPTGQNDPGRFLHTSFGVRETTTGELIFLDYIPVKESETWLTKMKDSITTRIYRLEPPAPIEGKSVAYIGRFWEWDPAGQLVFPAYGKVAPLNQAFLTKLENDRLRIVAEIPASIPEVGNVAQAQIQTKDLAWIKFSSGKTGVVLVESGAIILYEDDLLPNGRQAVGISQAITSWGNTAYIIAGGSLWRVTLPQAPPPIKAPEITSVISATGDAKDAFSPGDFLSAYGKNLTGFIWDPSQFPLPAAVVGNPPFASRLGLCEVLVNGKPAPLHFAVTWANDRSSQVNFILPEDTPLGEAEIIIRRLRSDLSVESVSNPWKVKVVSANPRFFRVNGLVIQQNVNKNYDLVSLENPARPGDWITTYSAGWGITDPPVKAGYLPETLAKAIIYPQIWLWDGVAHGWTRCEVWENSAFASPQFPGVYQISFRIPENYPTDSQGRTHVRVFAGEDLSTYTDFITYIQGQ